MFSTNVAIAAENRLAAGKIDQAAVSDIVEQTANDEQAEQTEQIELIEQVEQDEQIELFERVELVEQEIADQVVEHFDAELNANMVLVYDPADIAAIGNQNESGHSICCPSYACAYADAVLDGTVNDHSYYTCSCCSWQDWGGGNSSYRCVGSDEDVLREAYDQISSGKPVVTHVSWEYGEHWIALIGYQNVTDPDHLTLDNFIALNPSDGAQIVASSGYALYGDGCQHVSER